MIASKGDKIYTAIIGVFLTVIALLTLYPFWYVLIASLSSGKAVAEGSVYLYPIQTTFGAYKELIFKPEIWSGYANSIFITVVGTVISMTLTICGAYPLSKTYFKGGKTINFLVVFTMWFQAGMIPTYLNFIELGLRNTWGVIIGLALNTFNVILMINFFRGVPKALEEAATIDGATDLQVLTKIFLPLSKPALATISLFYGVSRWNGYFWSMILIRDENKYPLNVWLKSWIVENNMVNEVGSKMTATYSAETFIYATIIIAVVPMMILYPFVQKYFVQGVMVGAVKE
ncbi:carbohydrate ABC transporter permease [Niameybacter massiliensis]|uniref:Carbohydrate ABC transporter permease n=1 Tax=Holtiella tumoricola TaxID=3018743 RepID=A0AA42DQ94_9FIRM|nr:carbohydrate ABC transporter permease [Holtiella tumoricola]MDA3733268.1 carbohydrate ABC transporter permease [Holtiella tumoricola]